MLQTCEHFSFNLSSSSTSISSTAKLSPPLCLKCWVWEGSSILFELYFVGNKGPIIWVQLVQQTVNDLSTWCTSGNQLLNKQLCGRKCSVLAASRAFSWHPEANGWCLGEVAPSALCLTCCSFLKTRWAPTVGTQHTRLPGVRIFPSYFIEMRHTICLRGWEICDAIEWMPKLHSSLASPRFGTGVLTSAKGGLLYGKERRESNLDDQFLWSQRLDLSVSIFWLFMQCEKNRVDQDTSEVDFIKIPPSPLTQSIM